jgi:hypothetical protein
LNTFLKAKCVLHGCISISFIVRLYCVAPFTYVHAVRAVVGLPGFAVLSKYHAGGVTVALRALGGAAAVAAAAFAGLKADGIASSRSLSIDHWGTPGATARRLQGWHKCLTRFLQVMQLLLLSMLLLTHQRLLLLAAACRLAS